MNHKVSLSGNILLTSAKKIAALCKPLNDMFGISFFRYMKLFDDGRRLILSNRPEVIRYNYEEGYYNLTWHDSARPASFYESGCDVWAIKSLTNTKEQDEFKNNLKKFFNLLQGVAFLKKHKNSLELYDFYSPTAQIYSLKKEIFNHFMLYFKEHTQKLMINTPSEMIKVPPINEQSQIQLDSYNNNESRFLKLLKIKRYYLSGQLEGRYLTDREHECLKWCINGKTAEETAILLGVSKKTVETHLYNIKSKLDCHKQNHLIYTSFAQGINFFCDLV